MTQTRVSAPKNQQQQQQQQVQQQSGSNVQLKQGLRGLPLDQQQQQLAPQGSPPVQMRKRGGGGKGGGGKGGGGKGGGGKGGGGKGGSGPTSQTTTPPVSGPNQTQLTQSSQQLGEVEDIDGAFQAIGGIVDAFAPTAGQGFSGQLDVKVKPPQGTGFYLNLNFEGTAKRNVDDKLELEGKMAIVVGAAGKLGYFDGYAGARGMLAMKATAEHGYGAFRLMGLGIHQAIAAWTTKGANWLFGQSYEEDTVGSMISKEKGDKRADSLEMVGELGVEGGLGGGDESTGGEGKLAAGYRGKTTYSKEKDSDKKVSTETERGFMAVLGAKAKAAGVEFEGAADVFLVSGKEPQWELKGELSADPEKLKNAVLVAKYIGDVMGGAVGMLRSGVATRERSKEGSPALWSGLRTALSAVSLIPKATLAKAMVEGAKDAPTGSKPAFELGLKFEGKQLKEFGLESLQKYEPGEETKQALGAVGVELGGKTSQTLVNKKN